MNLARERNIPSQVVPQVYQRSPYEKAQEANLILGKMIPGMYQGLQPTINGAWSEANPNSFAQKKPEVDKYAGMAIGGLGLIGSLAEMIGAAKTNKLIQQQQAQQYQQ